MITKLDHVGIVVRDIDKALSFFSTPFGLRPWRRGIVESPELGIKTVLLPIGKDQSIEIIEPTDPQKHFGQHLRTRGEGLYHLCLMVDDIDAEVSSLREKGVPVGEARVIPPSFPVPLKNAWVGPQAAFGANIELVELL